MIPGTDFCPTCERHGWGEAHLHFIHDKMLLTFCSKELAKEITEIVREKLFLWTSRK